MSNDLKETALEYHRATPAGKLGIVPTKPMATQVDLSLAYSPGVAAACEEIVRDAGQARTLTARGNLVAVISNGTAVLGLGNIGALASKPVMEGKAVLFKKFSGVDVFDIEVDEADPEKLVEIVASLEPTFGGINLEDIKSPECFYVEEKLRERMHIPVFHDDQHGTAIVAGAALLNGLRVVGKDIANVKLVTSGAGAAALSCLNLIVSMGMPKENVTVVDSAGVIYKGRTERMDAFKERYAQETDARTLEQAVDGADVFLGLSGPGLLKRGMVERMADKPLILALANPVPEILPEEAKAVRPDAILATGRSDYPNQVNNVLCFPFIFRGALDVGATTINEEMKLACVRAIADLATAQSSEVVTKAYGGKPLKFGPDYLIPKPFDPRLITQIAPAVAEAAMESGVATRPIEDLRAYRDQLSQFVYRSGFVMRPILDQAQQDPRRVVYAEGEEERVLQAAQQVIDEGIAKPVLIGRASVVERRIEALSLAMRPGKDFELVTPLKGKRFDDYLDDYHQIMGRRGVSPAEAQTVIRGQNTAVAALMLKRGEADAMLCGTVGRFRLHVQHVLDIVGKRPGVRDVSTLNALILDAGTFFVCDTYVTPDPSAEEVAEMTLLSAEEVRRFGLTPKVALLSRSNFGSHDMESAVKMRKALGILHREAPELEAEGEMHADAALSEDIRRAFFPASRLKGQANLLVMPNVDAANIAHKLLKILGHAVSIGPILVGAALPAHVVTQEITVRGLVNMSAMAVAQAHMRTGGISGGRSG